MATLTPEQRKQLRDSLTVLKDKLKKLRDAYTSRNQTTFSQPSGQVAGASTSQPLNAAQIGGASGIGFENIYDVNTQNIESSSFKDNKEFLAIVLD